MALNLTTNSWEHLSGTIEGVPTVTEPNLRILPCMWAAPNERKIYIMYGSANRTLAAVHHASGGADIDYPYDDFWSYDVDSKKWERERLRGNFPSPRTEATSSQCDSVGGALVYGGYHGCMRTMETKWALQERHYSFSYFGDTFLFDSKTRNWKHVLVKGFPSYRAMSTVVCDPETGKIYLFGGMSVFYYPITALYAHFSPGYTNSDFVPSNALNLRVYYDVWQLKINTEGGHWNEDDLKRDLRSEKMGPWMRCFACGKCGITWQKCAGSCGGKTYFCSENCQKAGWKEHKAKFSCSKV